MTATVKIEVDSTALGLLDRSTSLNDEQGAVFIGWCMDEYPTKDVDGKEVTNTPQEAIEAAIADTMREVLHKVNRYAEEKAVTEAMVIVSAKKIVLPI